MYGSMTSWCNENIAERLTFSSFTSSPSEQFGVGEIIRPYAIVAFPGYKIPEGLDKRNKDALWLDEAPKERAVVVWDGYCPYALHEVIYECFGFKPGKISGMIGVVDVQTKKLVHDDREPRILAIRPRPRFIEGQREYRNHIADLMAWSYFFRRLGKNGEIFSHNGGTTTIKLYDDIFTFSYPYENSVAQSRDSSFFCHLLDNKETMKFKPSKRSAPHLKRGPVGLIDDKDIVVRLTGLCLRNEFSKNGPFIEDVEVLKENPASLYQMSLSEGRDPVTGHTIGYMEEMMALAATSRLTAETEAADNARKGTAREDTGAERFPLPREKVSFKSLMQTLKARSNSF